MWLVVTDVVIEVYEMFMHFLGEKNIKSRFFQSKNMDLNFPITGDTSLMIGKYDRPCD